MSNATDRAMLSHIFALPGNGKKKRKVAKARSRSIMGRTFEIQPHPGRRSWEGWFADQQGVTLEAGSLGELLTDAAGEALASYEERVLAGRKFRLGFTIEWVRAAEVEGESDRKSFAEAAAFYWEMIEEAGKPQDNPIVQVQLYGISERGSLEALDGWWRAAGHAVRAAGEAEPELRGTLNA